MRQPTSCAYYQIPSPKYRRPIRLHPPRLHLPRLHPSTAHMPSAYVHSTTKPEPVPYTVEPEAAVNQEHSEPAAQERLKPTPSTVEIEAAVSQEQSTSPPLSTGIKRASTTFPAQAHIKRQKTVQMISMNLHHPSLLVTSCLIRIPYWSTQAQSQHKNTPIRFALVLPSATHLTLLVAITRRLPNRTLRKVLLVQITMALFLLPS